MGRGAPKGKRLNLSTPLLEVRGIGPKKGAALASAGLSTVEDLLLSLPFRYEDRSRFATVASLAPGDRVALRGTIERVRFLRTRSPGFTILEAVLSDATGRVFSHWYNQPFLRNLLKERLQLVVFGEATLPQNRRRPLLFKNPQFEMLGDDPEGIHTGKIVPIYRKTAGLSTRSIRALVHRILKSLPDELPDPLPRSLSSRPDLCSRGRSFREVHFPPRNSPFATLERGMTPAHRRLALEELYALQCSFARARSLRLRSRAISCPTSPEFRGRLRMLCPFPLTGAQERVLGEILADLESSRPMQRLLQGDVACGKTVVALLAAVAAMQAGCQVAWMVPTEILAEQHHRVARELLQRTRFRVKLLTSRTRESPGADHPGGAEDEADLCVGTQALIQDAAKFRRLGFVVVDEQHRFGVRQRETLRTKGENPHQLFMTATPIPRSMALAFYGDLDVSAIDELPPGRVPVRTLVRTAADREGIYRFIRDEVARGGRAAFVVPSVESGKDGPEGSAITARQRLATTVFPDLRVGLLHGGLDAEERRRTLRDFASGAAPVLVATTVVEVGLDVPEASVMVVEHADRFGLSQIHQMRGRVGRGSRPSWCILIPAEQATSEATERIRILQEVSDGFEIARRDLQLRGPGELLGFRQSGLPDLRVADLSRDLDLLEAARKAASHLTRFIQES